MHVIIENRDFVNLLTQDAIDYIKTKSKINFEVFSAGGTEELRKKVINLYDQGVRKFILSITSNEILSIKDLIIKYKDAKFVCPVSTLISLRGMFPNVYFTGPSDTYLRGSAGSTSCIVYDNIEDPFVKEAVDILTNGGQTANFHMNDFRWRQFESLFLVSVTKDIWTVINSNLPSDGINHSVYSIEAYPPNDIVFSPKLLAINILFPLPVIRSQINSTWNILTKNHLFSQNDNVTNTYPLLLTQSWSYLEKMGFISNVNQETTYYSSRYLPQFEIDIKNNDHNCHVKNYDNWIWITANEYVDEWSCNNWRYITAKTNKIKEHVTTDCVKHEVLKYYTRGHRHFILDASSSDVRKLQNLDLKGLFICLRATDPTLRRRGSRFLFSQCDDTTFVQDRCKAYYYYNDFRSVMIVGSSDNVNTILLKNTLTKDKIPWLTIHELDTVPPDTKSMVVIGNRSDYDQVYKYSLKNLPNLLLLSWNQDYPTETQQKVLANKGQIELFFELNYTSCDLFRETLYYEISNPDYVSKYGYHFLKNTSNILLIFPTEFLYDYGYIIDV